MFYIGITSSLQQLRGFEVVFLTIFQFLIDRIYSGMRQCEVFAQFGIYLKISSSLSEQGKGIFDLIGFTDQKQLSTFQAVNR